ncbi:helix-turn-helix domain-containing protein [Flavobacteriaceae bacterium M23B6Z8]
MRLYFILFFVFFLQINLLFAQERDLTYQELAKLFYEEEDTTKAKEYALSYLKKAKLERDSLKLSDGYFFISLISHDSLKLIYADSLIQLNIQNPNFHYPGFGYKLKADFFYLKRNFKEALDNYILSQKYARENGHRHLENKVMLSIGLIKSRIGEDREALEIFRKVKGFMDNENYQKNYTYTYLVSLFAFSDSYQRNYILDSATILNQRGYDLSRNVSEKKMSNYFAFNQGITQLSKKNYDAAIDSFSITLHGLVEYEDFPNVALSYFYQGKANWLLGKQELAVSQFKKTDSIFGFLKDLHPDAREGYLYLIAYYKEKGLLDQELFYIQKLLKLDSILQGNYKYLSKKIIRDYDTGILLNQKENVIRKLQAKKNIFKVAMVSFFGLSVILIIALIFYYQRQKKYKLQFRRVLADLSLPDEPKTLYKNKSIDIPKEILDDLKYKIEEFTEQEFFLDPNVSLTSLAKDLQTNSSYLSRFINHFYRKNFNSFINDLRIDYITKRLNYDHILKNFTIQAIAEEAGFKNTVSFTQAFYKKNKIKPSYFLKRIKEKN